MTKYIKLEDVQKIISNRIFELAKDSFYGEERQALFPLREKINSLSSIDFEGIIDSVEDTVYVNGLLYVNAPELLNKLP